VFVLPCALLAALFMDITTAMLLECSAGRVTQDRLECRSTESALLGPQPLKGLLVRFELRPELASLSAQ